jgi:glutathione S-transferase
MSTFRLHCFYESGNSYKPALMLNLAGADWTAVPVAYFTGETRDAAWRERLNEMGEAPVLEHLQPEGTKILTQSGVILDYLAETLGVFGANDKEEQREIWRWILFDNHKFTSYYATLRFLYGLKKTGETEVTTFLRGRTTDAYRVVDKHLTTQDFLVGGRPTIADLSLAGYVYYPEETGMDVARDFPAIEAWKARIAALPGWQSPAALMPKV